MINRIVLFFVFGSVAFLTADQIPPFFLDAVVALGRSEAPTTGQPAVWKTQASGFFYGWPLDKETDPEKHQYALYLVTNRHVLANLTSIAIRLNPEKPTDPVQEFPLALQDAAGSNLWLSHPDTSIDIAVMRINAPFLKERGLKRMFFAADNHAADKAKLKDIELSVGEGLFVLGFPMGLSGAQRNYVIPRRGSIGRISEMLDAGATSFLIDSFVFPGNSGGPVVSVPNVNAIQGTKAQDHAYLIGVVRGYLPYTDVAISQQTGQVRMVLQENSGLAEVIPMDYVNEIIKATLAKLQSSRPATK